MPHCERAPPAGSSPALQANTLPDRWLNGEAQHTWRCKSNVGNPGKAQSPATWDHRLLQPITHVCKVSSMLTGEVEQAQEAQQLLRGFLIWSQDEGRGLGQPIHLQHIRLIIIEAVLLRQRQAQQEATLQCTSIMSCTPWHIQYACMERGSRSIDIQAVPRPRSVAPQVHQHLIAQVPCWCRSKLHGNVVKR